MLLPILLSAFGQLVTSVRSSILGPSPMRHNTTFSVLLGSLLFANLAQAEDSVPCCLPLARCVELVSEQCEALGGSVADGLRCDQQTCLIPEPNFLELVAEIRQGEFTPAGGDEWGVPVFTGDGIMVRSVGSQLIEEYRYSVELGLYPTGRQLDTGPIGIGNGMNCNGTYLAAGGSLGEVVLYARTEDWFEKVWTWEPDASGPSFVADLDNNWLVVLRPQNNEVVFFNSLESSVPVVHSILDQRYRTASLRGQELLLSVSDPGNASFFEFNEAEDQWQLQQVLGSGSTYGRGAALFGNLAAVADRDGGSSQSGEVILYARDHEDAPWSSIGSFGPPLEPISNQETGVEFIFGNRIFASQSASCRNGGSERGTLFTYLYENETLVFDQVLELTDPGFPRLHYEVAEAGGGLENGGAVVSSFVEAPSGGCPSYGLRRGVLGVWAQYQDCDNNGVADIYQILDGSSPDLDLSGVLDCCENGATCEPDCDGDGTSDADEIASGEAGDINENGLPDNCEPDCDGDGTPDFVEIILGEFDCNANGIPDSCEIADGTSEDNNGNSFLDECELDCNTNGVFDFLDLFAGTSVDCDGNNVPDECDIADGTQADCNTNGVPDECESFLDCDANGVPDECQPDTDQDGDIDPCDDDDDGDDIPDECDPDSTGGEDCDSNGVDDSCDSDTDGDTIPDACDDDIDGDGILNECDVDQNPLPPQSPHPEAVHWSVESGGNGHWYAVLEIPENRSKLFEQLGLIGASGASITSSEENNFVKALATQYTDQSVLLGAEESGENEFSWMDGSPFIYHDFEDGQPDGSAPDEWIGYYQLSADGRWHDLSFSDPEVTHYVAEWSNFELTRLIDPSVLWGFSFDSGFGEAKTGIQFFGSVEGNPEIVDNSLSLANSSSALVSDLALIPSEGESFAISVWVRDGLTTGIRQALSQGKMNILDEEELYIGRYNGDLRAAPFADVTLSCSNTSTLDAGAWQHLVMSFESESALASIYMNGELIIQQTICNTGCCGNNNGLIVGRQWNGGEYWGGEVDQLIIFNRPLTPDEAVRLSTSRSEGLYLQNSNEDCNFNGVLDGCEIKDNDCNSNGVPDDCELSGNDCNANGVPDECDVVNADCDGNSIPDDCEQDTDGDTIPDACDDDLDGDGIPNECDVDQDSSGLNPVVYFPFDSESDLDEWNVNGSGEFYPTVTDHLVLPGEPAHLQLGQQVVPIDGEFTISLWMKNDSSPVNSWRMAFNQIVPGERPIWIGAVRNTGNFRANPWLFDGEPESESYPYLEPGRWYHVAATADWTSGTGSLYLDGELVQSGVFLDTDTQPLEFLVTYLGRQHCCGNEYWTGGIDQILIYDRQLSLAEVQALAVSRTSIGTDCNSNGVLDECEIDSDDDGSIDECDPDDDNDGVPDECDPDLTGGPDCDNNGVDDLCELGEDCNSNSVPDRCESDLDEDGVIDDCDPDDDGDGVPDECDPRWTGGEDCDANGIDDTCEPDLDEDGTIDACDPDIDGDGILNECDASPGAVQFFYANSKEDFAAEQGSNGWRYRWSSLPSLEDIQDISIFDELGECVGHPEPRWNVLCEENAYVGATITHPTISPCVTPVIEYTLPFSGDAYINVFVFDHDGSSGDGTQIRLFADEQLIDTWVIGNVGEFIDADFTIPLQQFSTIRLAVDSNGCTSQDGDGVMPILQVSSYPLQSSEGARQWPISDGGNGHWYQYVEGDRVCWNTANQLAQDLYKGHLASITSEAEGQFLIDLSGPIPGDSGGQAWIGLFQDPNGEEPLGGWGWTTGEPLTYENWRPNCCSEPNYPGADFGTIVYDAAPFPSGVWNDYQDCNLNGRPQFFVEWSADCNNDGIVDYGQILDGTFADDDQNGVPDCCDQGVPCSTPFGEDCNGNGVLDSCELEDNDCNTNGIPDDCEIFDDCNANGVGDPCDIASGTSQDVNADGVPDECQCIADFVSDGLVDFQELLAVLSNWGPCGPPCPPDINADGEVSFIDLLRVLEGWGPCDP